VPGFGVLFALRIALGFAEAPSFPSAAQTIHRVLPADQRGRAIGVLFTGSSIGAMVAPPLASICAEHFGWRTAFLATALVGLCWVPAWIAFAYRGPARGRLDRPPEPVSGVPEPSFVEVATHPAVLRGMVLVFASAPGLAFLLLWPAKFLVHQYGLSQAQVGMYLWFPPLLFDLGSVIFGDLASRRDRARSLDGEPHRALVAAAAVLECGIAVVPFASSPAIAMVLAGIAMAGGGGMFALATHDMLSRVPKSAVSRAGGMTAASQSLAHIIFNPLIGAIVQRFGGYEPVTVGLGAWVIPGTIVWLLWRAPPAQAVLQDRSPA
jgi:ACS family hexuronate transporter-like MFS transporter